MNKEQEEHSPKFTAEEKANWEAKMNPRLPDFISVSNMKLVSLKHLSPEKQAAAFGLPTLEGIPFAIDDSLGSDPGYVHRYL